MDLWLTLSLIAAAIFCVAVIALQIKTDRRKPRLRCCENMNPTHPMWSQDGFISRCKWCNATLFYGDKERPTDPFAVLCIETNPRPSHMVFDKGKLVHSGGIRREDISNPDVPVVAKPFDDAAFSRFKAGSNFGDTPLKQAPPNIGGEGNPEYAGPNYSHAETIAEEMKGLIYYQLDGHVPEQAEDLIPGSEEAERLGRLNWTRPLGGDPTRTYAPQERWLGAPGDEATRSLRYTVKPLADYPEQTDLAVTYKHGCVAPDGTIWASETTRINAGIVELTPDESRKAARFGWRRIGVAMADSTFVTMHRFQS